MPQDTDQPPAAGAPPDLPILSYEMRSVRPGHSLFIWLSLLMGGITVPWLGCDVIILSHWPFAAWSPFMPLARVLDQFCLLPGVVTVAFAVIGFARDGEDILGKGAIYTILLAYVFYAIGYSSIPD